jgi:hypothetical protein
MAGAPAGPALDPERPADRLDAVREADESRPVRRAGRAQQPAGSARPPGASPPRPGCSPETLGSNLRATAVARTPQLHRRLAVLAEDNERCWSSRAPWPASSRGGRCSAEPHAHRARGRRTRAAPRRAPLLTSSDRPSKRRLNPRASASGCARPTSTIAAGSGRTANSTSACESGSSRRLAAPRARALLRDRESLSKGRGAPVNLSSCSPFSSSRTYGDVATVVDFNASSSTPTGTSR